MFNVVSSTIKTVATVKSKPSTAAIINSLNYTIAAIITKLITQQDFEVIILVTMATNMLGVPFGRYIIDKFSKDNLWVYSVTLTGTQADAMLLKQQLSDKSIDCIYDELKPSQKYYLKIFSQTRKDSSIIKHCLKNYKVNYHIIETI